MTPEENQQNYSKESEPSKFLFRNPLDKKIVINIQPDKPMEEQVYPDFKGTSEFKTETGEPYIASYYNIPYKEMPESYQKKLDNIDDYVRRQIVMNKLSDTPEVVDSVLKQLEREINISDIDSYNKIEKLDDFLEAIPDHEIKSIKEKDMAVKEAKKQVEQKIETKIKDEKITELKKEVKSLKNIERDKSKVEAELLKYQYQAEGLQEKIYRTEEELNDARQTINELKPEAMKSERYQNEIESLRSELEIMKRELSEYDSYVKQQEREKLMYQQEVQRTKQILSNII